ncbi:hypothetical protein N0V82_000265 [Gnomoniopsis sp. IMI 355080]|nr:hypothetical protein N0V82_000265 [Gnomoniopsis sp. IMI 355080]
MSAPADGSQSSAKAIRVVPYTPPQAAKSYQESLGQEQFSTDDGGRRNPTSGQSSSSEYGRAPPFSMGEKRADGSVSARGEPATFRGSSTSDPIDLSTGFPPSVIPVTAAPPSRGRLSTATSYTTSSTRQSTSSRSSHISDTESEAPSTVGTSRRPQSRRRNFVAVLNDDKKTFSLVPQRPRAPDAQSLQSQDPPRSESALSEYGGGPSFRSSQLHYYPTTPRVSQASSHEGVSSYASSHDDRPNSSLAGNFPDRSITPATPTSVVPSSPGLTITEDFVPDSSPTQWNRRMGVRKVNADLEEKHSFHTQTSKSDTTETPPAAATDTTAPGYDENPVDTHSTQGTPPVSFHSPSNSSGSDRTNYRIYGDDDTEAPIEHNPDPANPGEDDQGSDDSRVDPHLRPQPSFATAQTGSTEFENSNYKIYEHSDSEGSEEDHQDSPVTGPSSRALRIPHIPLLETQSSVASLQSVASSTSENPNYRVYGPSSPGLEPVPESEPLQGELRPAQSFLSAGSSIADNDNYIVYGHSSPAALSSIESFNPPSESGSYAPLISANAVEQAAGPSSPTNDNPNYIVHGDPTPEPSREATPNTSESGESSVRDTPHQEEESQESAVVSPLRPRRSQEGFGYFRARSRSVSKEDLRTKKSLKSVKSSISSIINEDSVAESFFAGQAYLDGPPGEYEVSSPSVAGPSERQRQLDEQRERERQQRESSAWEGEGAATGSPGSMALPTTPHQWSSQLSAILSETEPEESSGTRSSLASVSLPGGSVHGSQSGSQGSHERRNSRGWSTHSRQMLSISSSLAADLEAASRSRSNSQPGSVERPSPSYRYQGQVRHHDEDGDGLADLQMISPRPSRSRLSDMFNHSNSSDRNLHSSASSRSFNNGIPTWAKLYYGSGERRFWRSASISSASDLSSRPESMLQHSNSPNSDQFPTGLWNARRRPMESGPGDPAQRQSAIGSMDTLGRSADDHVHDIGFRRSLRRMTSSVWSPHLQRDVRAQNRYSIWDSPSVAWSAESGMFGRRNLQVVLFVVGFIFPFAWMIGALLPLPKPSPLAMVQRDSSYSDLGIRSHSNEFERHIESVDELRFQNARWWRTLNRCMSVIGLLIIGAIVGLAVAAVKQDWATRR